MNFHVNSFKSNRAAILIGLFAAGMDETMIGMENHRFPPAHRGKEFRENPKKRGNSPRTGKISFLREMGGYLSAL